MHTITITEDTKPLPGDAPKTTPVTVEVGSGDHLVIIRKGNPAKRRERFAATFERMSKRTYNPEVETAAQSLEAMRNRG